jgi:arginyl-tRNA synthetase
MDRGKTDVTWDEQAVNRLRTQEEIQLMKAMARYPDVVQHSGESLEPHHITYYLTRLAALFHAYYNKHRVLTDDPILSHGRLYLVFAVKKVIKSGLTLLGVSAPEKM